MTMMTNSPGNDDETVESIPRFGQVSAFTINSHGDHFDGHFNGEKGKNEIVQHLSFIQTEMNMKIILFLKIEDSNDTFIISSAVDSIHNNVATQ